MIEQSQIELTKSFWEQSKAAAQQAHEAWGMVMKSQKAILESMRGAGLPFSLAADQYDKLIEFQSQQYKATLDYMEKMAADYQHQLSKHKK